GAARQVPLALAVHPEHAAVFPPPPRGCGGTDKRGPALGQQARAVPHAVSQVQEPKPRPVARRPVVVSAEQEIAPWIGLEYLAPNADAIEERALRIGEVLLTALLDRLPYEKPERHRIGIAITPHGVWRKLHRRCDRVRERVDGAGVDEEVI